MEFEWDLAKEDLNWVKHGLTFIEAVEAFKDPNGVHLFDSKHSDQEKRFLWIGKLLNSRVITVWYTKRENKIRIIGCAELRKMRSIYYEAAKIK